jgi:hypothetical protein
MIQRRDLLAGAAATGALSLLPLDLHGTSRAADDGWNAGLVAHLLPTVSHDRILLKASFHEPLKDIPFFMSGGGPLSESAPTAKDFFGNSMPPVWSRAAPMRWSSRTHAGVRYVTSGRSRPSRPRTTSRSNCACSFSPVRAVTMGSASIFP